MGLPGGLEDGGGAGRLGPPHTGQDGRLIDLSFAAAVKLGVYPHGTARVRVHGLTPDDMPDRDERIARDGAPSAAASD